MGLDMYIIRKNEQGKDVELAYWRKANQIRAWLVRHNIIEDDDNCYDRPITMQNLRDLVDDCEKVLINHDLAKEILPTSMGFFFGSTEYDDWYYYDLIKTIVMLQPIIDNPKYDNETLLYYDWY